MVADLEFESYRDDKELAIFTVDLEFESRTTPSLGQLVFLAHMNSQNALFRKWVSSHPKIKRVYKEFG